MMQEQTLALSQRAIVATHDGSVGSTIASALGVLGYQVTVLSTGLELFNELAPCVFDGISRPDLVVADVALPEFTGLDVLGSVHYAELTVPFILITRYSDSTSCTEARRLGAFAVLHEPVDVELLGALIKYTLHREAQRRN